MSSTAAEDLAWVEKRREAGRRFYWAHREQIRLERAAKKKAALASSQPRPKPEPTPEVIAKATARRERYRFLQRDYQRKTRAKAEAYDRLLAAGLISNLQIANLQIANLQDASQELPKGPAFGTPSGDPLASQEETKASSAAGEDPTCFQ